MRLQTGAQKGLSTTAFDEANLSKVAIRAACISNDLPAGEKYDPKRAKRFGSKNGSFTFPLSLSAEKRMRK
jgi:hypothetical protein